jgi:hypothetical protein
MIKLINYKANFSTNSSSDHMIIMAGTASKANYAGDNGYGWEEFLLNTTEEKTRYFAQMLFEMTDSIDLCRKIFGQSMASEKGYVDHQSVLMIPVCINSQMQHPDWIEFYKLMAYEIINDDTAEISGGNDNIDEPYQRDPHPIEIIFDMMRGKESHLKHEGNIWTLFENSTGRRIKIQFVEGKCVYENAGSVGSENH